MKQYVSAILIPCLLMQLFGCYSYREITIEELKSYKGENDIKIITDKDTILINRDSSELLKMDWVVSDTSILVQEKRSLDSSDKENPIHNKKEIKFKEIKSVAIDKPDSEKTEGLILLLMAIAVIITGYIVGQSIPTFNN